MRCHDDLPNASEMEPQQAMDMYRKSRDGRLNTPGEYEAQKSGNFTMQFPELSLPHAKEFAEAMRETLRVGWDAGVNMQSGNSNVAIGDGSLDRINHKRKRMQAELHRKHELRLFGILHEAAGSYEDCPNPENITKNRWCCRGCKKLIGCKLRKD